MSLHTTPIDVRFGDTDMFGHVNNAAFATYVETARLAFMRDRLDGTPERPGGAAGGIILARLAIDFRQQLHFGQSAHVTTEVERIGRSSVTLHQQVIADERVVADVSSVVVAYDYQARQPVAISDEIRLQLGFEKSAPEA